MMARVHRLNDRGGVVLDLLVAGALALLVAFGLDLLGVNLAQLLSGAGRFFGV